MRACFRATECKWRNGPVDVGVLEKLRERAGYLKAATGDTPLYLFSKSGFTKGLLEAARADGRVHLVAAEEMLDA